MCSLNVQLKIIMSLRYANANETLWTNLNEEFCFINNCLHQLWYPNSRHQQKRPITQLVAPQVMQSDILEAAHDNKMAGHLGQKHTYEQI